MTVFYVAYAIHIVLSLFDDLIRLCLLIKNFGHYLYSYKNVFLQAMWEDDKTNKKWVNVTRCFFPDDLPEGVGRPCAPESNEVKFLI